MHPIRVTMKGGSPIIDDSRRRRNADAELELSGALVSSTGSTPDGLPLAYSRAPAPDLAPWVQSLAAVDIETAVDRHQCRFFSANPAIRVFLRGKWQVETADGPCEFDTENGSRTIYFGPQTRAMPVKVDGPMRFLLLQFHPGAPPLDQSLTHVQMLDRIECFDEGLPDDIRNAGYGPSEKREEWIDHFERLTRRVLFDRVKEEPPALALATYRRILTDPATGVDEMAEEFGVSRRTLERQVKESFGISPKKVIRRARALDMAAALFGVAMPQEEAEFRLRYFDQSHMTREINTYFGMAPGVLSRQDAILLRIDLEVRQMRRLEAMGELGIEDVPWRDPDAEPTSRDD